MGSAGPDKKVTGRERRMTVALAMILGDGVAEALVKNDFCTF